MRGEFKRQNGLLLPNNLSLAGGAMILAAALRGDLPTLYAGLVTGLPSTMMTSAQMTEPTIGVNGYARIPIPLGHAGWPTQGTLGVESFITSQWMTWAAVGGAFDQLVQRVMLIGTATLTLTDPVYALSAPFEAAETIDPDTILADRTFQYSLYC